MNTRGDRMLDFILMGIIGLEILMAIWGTIVIIKCSKKLRRRNRHGTNKRRTKNSRR